MPVLTFTVERFSVVSTKPFEQIVAVIDAAIGHPDMAEFGKAMAASKTYEEMAAIVKGAVGPVDLMEFMRLNLGGAIGKGDPAYKCRVLRLIVGNPRIMRSMAEHVPDAGSYAPVTILVDERTDGVHLSYDRMASFLAPYKHAGASGIAEALDRKVEDLLLRAAGDALVG